MKNPVQKAMVCLDFTETDQTLIAYADFMANIMQVEELIFLHAMKDADLPRELENILSVEQRDFKGFLLGKMEETVRTILPEEHSYNIEFAITEGGITEHIVRFALSNEVDLVMLGRKVQSSGSGVILTRLARRLHCSLIIVPENTELVLDDILVCTDFSKWSEMALEAAVSFAAQDDSVTIYCQNIFEVPTGYHASGKSYNEFAKIMKKHAHRRYREFISKIDTQSVAVAPIFTLHRKGNTATLIKDTAGSVEVNLVILGSKGRTFASSMFLGSFAEKLIREEFTMPLMILKAKHETLGVIKALQMI